MQSYNLLKDKVAIVTGAASGFGVGIAELLHSEGANIIIADINNKGEELAEHLSTKGVKCIFINADITKASNWKAIMDRTLTEFGKVDILVNNAGWTYRKKDSLSVTEAEYDRVFDINVKSIFYATNAVLPHYLSRSSGSIINISSCITEKATPGLTWYGATKGAVDMITRHLATEYSSRGIRVNAVAPSISDTPLMREFLGEEPTQSGLAATAAMVPVGRLCGPMDIAKATLYFAAPHFNDFQTGIILRADGGNYA